MKKIEKENLENLLEVYKGILFQNQTFASDKCDNINYQFEIKEFNELKEKYDLVNIACRGTDFQKSKRLLHYLAPRLHHSSWYDNHIDCNALDLLAYSLNNKEQGINCLNKSKILEECCLALGIYARRVGIMPSSPYDFDNHVVTEIFDRKTNKWIMLDPTTDGYFIDENKMPLSLLEMRDLFANDKFITFVKSTDSLKDLPKLKEKYLEYNVYICKNLYYFNIDKDSTFGVTGKNLIFAPIGFSLKETFKANNKYRLNHLPAEYEEFREVFEKNLKGLEEFKEDDKIDIKCMLESPIL